MTTRKLRFKSINATASTYVGEVGTVFFDPATSQLRVGDGVTAGGNPVTLDIGLATHDDATYINNLLFQCQGPGFFTSTDSLHAISGRITANNLVQQSALNGISSGISNMASGTTLSAVENALSIQLSSVATSAGLATAQNSLNTITTNVSTMASGTTLTAVQSTLSTSIITASNTIQTSLKGIGFVPGTDDLHNIRSAISTLQADINSIKTHLGI
jgi:hypothetical protein